MPAQIEDRVDNRHGRNNLAVNVRPDLALLAGLQRQKRLEVAVWTKWTQSFSIFCHTAKLAWLGTGYKNTMDTHLLHC